MAMFTLRLSIGETELLRKILESYLSDLCVEIGDTEAKELRDVLKEEKSFINSLLQRLNAEDIPENHNRN
jgi:hypothetical protein